MSTTRKKTKVVGCESYINSKTGEVVDMEVIEIEERDANFHKLWLGHVIAALNLVGNKKIQVINHMLGEMNKYNQYIGTQRQIAERIGVSVKTVNAALSMLLKADFLKQENQGVYIINPDKVFRGGRNDRLNVLYRYKNIMTDRNALPGQVGFYDDEIDEDTQKNTI